jgi:hypothetical protein
MLMLHHFDAEDYEIWHDSDLTILGNVLRSCHLEEDDSSSEQLSLLQYVVLE